MNEFTGLVRRDPEALLLEAYLHQHEAIRTEKFLMQRASIALLAVLFSGTLLALGIIKPPDKPLSDIDSDTFALIIVGQLVIISGYMLLQAWVQRMSAFIAGLEHKINVLVGERAFDWELRWHEVSFKNQSIEALINFLFHGLVALIIGFEIWWASCGRDDIPPPFGASWIQFLGIGWSLLAALLIASFYLPFRAKQRWHMFDSERSADATSYVHDAAAVGSVTGQSVDDSENMQSLQFVRRSIVIIVRWNGLYNPKE